MVLLENLFFLFSGFTLLILSGDKLVETSVRIARRWKVPASVIAVTIIAAGTSAPELVTSFIAGLRGSGDIAVGNVIGSNTFNLLAVGGLSLLLQPFIETKGTLSSWLALLGASAFFFFSLFNLELTSIEALFFLLALIGFLVLSFFKERDKENTFENLESKSFSRTIVFFLLSLAGLIFGAELALSGGVALGKMAGLSERVIAITIISVGTGLPELATSVAAAFRGHGDIAISNVIGSNIFNTLAIPGATASLFPLTVNAQFLDLDFYVMITATVSLGLVYLAGRPWMRKTLGVLMLTGYFTYTFHLIGTAS
ncbi:MAG: calcium/sodium antiporter [Pseudomonadota bacterium]